MFLQTEFLQVQKQLGREFTVDCFSRDDGTNSHCRSITLQATGFFQRVIQWTSTAGLTHPLITSGTPWCTITGVSSSTRRELVLCSAYLPPCPTAPRVAALS
jgi:hypothetical protein